MDWLYGYFYSFDLDLKYGFGSVKLQGCSRNGPLQMAIYSGYEMSVFVHVEHLIFNSLTAVSQFLLTTSDVIPRVPFQYTILTKLL